MIHLLLMYKHITLIFIIKGPITALFKYAVHTNFCQVNVIREISNKTNISMTFNSNNNNKKENNSYVM
jgi:hypothetical protein